MRTTGIYCQINGNGTETVVLRAPLVLATVPVQVLWLSIDSRTEQTGKEPSPTTAQVRGALYRSLPFLRLAQPCPAQIPVQACCVDLHRQQRA